MNIYIKNMESAHRIILRGEIAACPSSLCLETYKIQASISEESIEWYESVPSELSESITTKH